LFANIKTEGKTCLFEVKNMIVADLNFCEIVEFTNIIIGGVSVAPNGNANANYDNYDNYDFALPNSNVFAMGDVTNTSSNRLKNADENMEMTASFAESK
jgi:hypothetical protein